MALLSYDSSVSRLADAVMHYHKQVDWTPLQSARDVKTWYRDSPHFAGTLYKFECDVNLPDDVVYSVMKPPRTTKERLSWDTSIKHYECVRHISDDRMIGSIITHSAAFGMISSREFVDLYYFKQHVEVLDQDCDRISWIFAESIDYPEKPATPKYVRAWNYPTGYAVSRYRNDPCKCKLTLYINVDIGGMIPRYLVEKAIPNQQVAYIETIKKQAHKTVTK